MEIILTQFEHLSESEVHVWKLNLHPYKFCYQDSILSKTEKERASQYVSVKDREAYRVRHAILRIILGHYLETEPSKILFEENPYGKLALVDKHLFFNLSKSPDWVYYAFSKNFCLGIDIEKIQPTQIDQEVEKLVFNSNEYEVYRHLPSEEKIIFFYRCWSQKEALVKGIGLGFNYPLRDAHHIQWLLYSLEMPEGYVGYLASNNQTTIKYYSI